jgi:hypothetical protein
VAVSGRILRQPPRNAAVSRDDVDVQVPIDFLLVDELSGRGVAGVRRARCWGRVLGSIPRAAAPVAQAGRRRDGGEQKAGHDAGRLPHRPSGIPRRHSTHSESTHPSFSTIRTNEPRILLSLSVDPPYLDPNRSGYTLVP